METRTYTINGAEVKITEAQAQAYKGARVLEVQKDLQVARHLAKAMPGAKIAARVAELERATVVLEGADAWVFVGHADSIRAGRSGEASRLLDMVGAGAFDAPKAIIEEAANSPSARAAAGLPPFSGGSTGTYRIAAESTGTPDFYAASGDLEINASGSFEEAAEAAESMDQTCPVENGEWHVWQDTGDSAQHMCCGEKAPAVYVLTRAEIADALRAAVGTYFVTVRADDSILAPDVEIYWDDQDPADAEWAWRTTTRGHGREESGGIRDTHDLAEVVEIARRAAAEL